jgi:diaminohydroxyphosphoribosylaminopyrimidine deaminase / 5-amino-6-(5-phosphoribosylamino)uracil reductase
MSGNCMDAAAMMRLAIAQARLAMGRTHPNPAVGAVVFHAGEAVAAGCTQPAGQDHAEIVALKAFAATGLRPDDSTVLVVTLEPCCTSGRTGPCTAAILQAGIRRVMVGATDPNPAHRGRGLEQLRGSGVAVEAGVLEEDCDDLNLIFNWRMQHGGPFFAGKIATTLDGRIATRGGLSKWITGEPARGDVHRWRRYFPAIAVGAGTVLADNPSLTARIEDEPEWCPVRFVFDRNLVSFKDGLPRLYADQWKERTVIVTGLNHAKRVKELEAAHGIRFWTVDTGGGDGGLAPFAARCREEGIDGVYIEGGANLLSAFLQHRHLHYLFAYRSPKLLADTSGLAPFFGQEPDSMAATVTLSRVRHATFGDDQLMRGFIFHPDP